MWWGGHQFFVWNLSGNCPRSANSHSRSSRTALVVLLLLVSLATATMIAVQAQYANATQRAAAESVLRDYSSLVADEVIRRSASEIGYYGYYPLTGAVLHEVQQTGNLPAEIGKKLRAAEDARVKRAASLAKSYFQMEPSTGRFVFLGEAPPEGVTIWLRQNLARLLRHLPLVCEQDSEVSESRERCGGEGINFLSGICQETVHEAQIPAR